MMGEIDDGISFAKGLSRFLLRHPADSLEYNYDDGGTAA